MRVVLVDKDADWRAFTGEEMLRQVRELPALPDVGETISEGLDVPTPKVTRVVARHFYAREFLVVLECTTKVEVDMSGV